MLKLSFFIAITAIACGGTDSQIGPEAVVKPDGAASSMVVARDKTYTIDDLKQAGWKKHRDFSVETLPQAEAAAFGFFNRKDIEVWVYRSHAEALRHGTGPADQAISRKPGQTDYLIPQVNRYHAYAIVGNLVLLCEFELADCESLIKELK
jgi:hypothetical protein